MTIHESIESVLKQIDDPEMPVSIFDLGLVTDIRLANAGTGAAVDIDLTPTFIGCPALDMIRAQVAQRVADLPGVSAVRVNWVNAPRWTVDRITDAGRERLRAHGVTAPERRSSTGWCNSDAAARATEEPHFVPLTISPRSDVDASAPTCPYCQSGATQMESRFGPTRCRSIFYCPACRNSFEHLRPI